VILSCFGFRCFLPLGYFRSQSVGFLVFVGDEKEHKQKEQLFYKFTHFRERRKGRLFLLWSDCSRNLFEDERARGFLGIGRAPKRCFTFLFARKWVCVVLNNTFFVLFLGISDDEQSLRNTHVRKETHIFSATVQSQYCVGIVCAVF